MLNSVLDTEHTHFTTRWGFDPFTEHFDSAEDEAAGTNHAGNGNIDDKENQPTTPTKIRSASKKRPVNSPSGNSIKRIGKYK